MSFKIEHKPDINRFEIHEKGQTAYAEYRIRGEKIDITHTLVPSLLGNMGIGSALVKAAYEWGAEQGLTPEGSCSFAAAWLRRHPENS